MTGFVVSSVDEAASAVQRVAGLTRSNCRAAFEERFSAARMAGDYLDVYRQLLARREGDRGGLKVFRPAA